MSDPDISGGLGVELEDNVIDDQLREAVMQLAEQKERILALALLRGYDGVDIEFTDRTPTRHWEYQNCINWEVWEGEPEPLERHGSQTQRYDFRVLRDHEKEQLLSRVGVFDLGEIGDG